MRYRIRDRGIGSIGLLLLILMSASRVLSPSMAFSQEGGTVDATVTVEGVCLLLSTNTINYGTQGFSTSLGNNIATESGPTLTNCGSSNLDIAASGTDATDGDQFTWSLVDTSAGDVGVCPQLNTYGHFVSDITTNFVDLSNLQQPFLNEVAPDADVPTDASLVLPCSGSDGGGAQFSFSIIYTGTVGSGGGGTDADGDGFTTAQGDCDDTNAAMNPGAIEVADGQDNDCDGQVDEAELVCDDGNPLTTDSVDELNGVCTFTPVSDGTPCDDGDPNTINDQAIDGVCVGTPSSTWYQDADLDTFGNLAVSQEAELPPAGFVADNTDCDDANAAVHPGAIEIADGIDNDCDGTIDDGVVLTPFYNGPPGTVGVGVCKAGIRDQFGTVVEPEVTPIDEVPGDGLDNDCDGVADEV